VYQRRGVAGDGVGLSRQWPSSTKFMSLLFHLIFLQASVSDSLYCLVAVQVIESFVCLESFGCSLAHLPGVLCLQDQEIGRLEGSAWKRGRDGRTRAEDYGQSKR
jgi:hypothetical protein